MENSTAIEKINIGIVNPRAFADGSVASVAPTRSEIDTLTARKNQIQREITNWRSEASKFQSYWDQRKDCGGLKKACNNWLDQRNDANNKANALQSELNDIVQNKLPDAERRYADAIKKFEESQRALQLTNPALVELERKSLLDITSAKNKKILIIGISITLILIAIGIVIYMIKTGKIGSIKPKTS